MSREEKLQELFKPEGKPVALDRIKIVEISHTNFATQIATALLCELGAEVVKIEPTGGDPARYVTPYGTLIEGVGVPYYIENRCKRILEMDYERDREKLSELLVNADILFDGMRPGELDKLGLGYRDLQKLNPKIIYVAVSSFGHVGEIATKYANIPPSDLTAQAYNGYPSLIGNPYLQDKRHQAPLRAGVWVATIMAGVQATFAALVALYWRELSGEGQFIDVAMNEVLSAVHLVPYIIGFFFEKPRGKYGLLDYILYPFGYYKTADGYVAIATPTDADFRALLKILGLWKMEPDWRYGIDRISDDIMRIKELDNAIRQTVARYKTRDLISKVLRHYVMYRKVPFLKLLERHAGAPVVVELYQLRRIVEENHWHLRRSIKLVALSDKTVVLPGSPFKFSGLRTID